MKVNGKDDIPYMKWKIKNVPNHQPALRMEVLNDDEWGSMMISWSFMRELMMINSDFHDGND
jgi:hypothetical protein